VADEAWALRRNARRTKSAFDYGVLADWLEEHGRPIEAKGCRNPTTCQHCGDIRDDVEDVEARTMYVWDGKGEDPNQSHFLCPPCAEEYEAHWDEMWSDYYSGLL
jgi:hypothetical protein